MSDFQLTKKDILQLIENEITWCKKNPDPDGTQAWNNGYMAGLANVKYIIQKAEKSIKESREEYLVKIKEPKND